MAVSKYKYEKKVVEKRKRRSIAPIILILILFFLVILSVDFSIINPIIEKKCENQIVFPSLISSENVTLVSLKVPAVDDKGKGVSTNIVVEAMPGSGRTFVDIDNLLFWADTQQSIRTARLVAANISHVDLNKYDLVYNVHVNASIIGGPSAGAALTIATIAALEGKEPNSSVMITGTINHDGTIGPVGGVLEKAKAAKDVNSTLFLVPLLQSRDVIYETREHCEKFGPTQICTTETVPKKIDIMEEAGIEVKEVGTVQEALQYMLN